jgi:uncharacterized protein YwgA
MKKMIIRLPKAGAKKSLIIECFQFLRRAERGEIFLTEEGKAKLQKQIFILKAGEDPGKAGVLNG